MHAAALGMRALALATALLATTVFAAEPPAGVAAPATKSADARPKAYNIGGALALGDGAGYQFQSVTGPVRLDIPVVLNESPTTTSGTVRIALFVTAQPNATAGTYWVIASADLGTLQPGFQFNSSSQTVAYAAPPDGTYYLHMGAFEYEPTTCTTSSGYCLDDYVSFVNRVQIVNGQIFDAGPPVAQVGTAVEYYHALFNHYFVTMYPNEIRDLDNGLIPGWQRTGESFPVWLQDGGGMAGVCRFFSGTWYAPRSSHFYGTYASDCTATRARPEWIFEAIAFYVELPDINGNCGTGRQPLYRLYNRGANQTPNHRYTTRLDVRQQMLNAGWQAEGVGLGVVACVPQ
ncbi:MAG TPA: hypothetical protein VFX05_16095 [Casimicrobiaceae bacterium]|nr:hypothetical protein [Casimicrobiaceae bacterium]